MVSKAETNSRALPPPLPPPGRNPVASPPDGTTAGVTSGVTSLASSRSRIGDRTSPCIIRGSRKRTSALVGCTFTSTSRGSIWMNTAATGCRSPAINPR